MRELPVREMLMRGLLMPGSLMRGVLRLRSGIGVVEVSGLIGGRASSPGLTRILDGVRTNKRFKAVIVEVDSPGGSASASELLFYSLQLVAQEKPVVVYIRGTGASGAYYLSCAAHKIVALPTSLVGSIGVIYVRPILQQLLRRLGVDVSVYKGGRFKDMSGPWRRPTAEEDEKFQGLIEEIYNNFVDVVARGRAMDNQTVRDLATGEIYTGRKARDLGLVDELGGFDRALELASELGHVRPRPIWIRPKRPLLERFAGRIGGPGVSTGLLMELERAMMGGLYYLAPWSLSGESADSEY